MYIYYNDKFINVGLTSHKDSLNSAIIIDNIEQFSFLPDNILNLFDKYDAIYLGNIADYKVLEHLKSCFNYIEAAGGLVRNELGESLMIFRSGKWDLPKGKMELGESSEECALREVEEECGVAGLELGSKICDTYHIYNMYNQWVLKKTYWYNMKSSLDQQLIPQLEEDISQVCWVSSGQLSDRLSNSYPSILEVFTTDETDATDASENK